MIKNSEISGPLGRVFLIVVITVIISGHSFNPFFAISSDAFKHVHLFVTNFHMLIKLPAVHITNYLTWH